MVRRDLGQKEFDRLSDYTDFLKSYITGNSILFLEENVRAVLRYNVFRLLSDICGEKPNASEIAQRIDERISKLEKIDSIEGFDAGLEKRIVETYATEIATASGAALKRHHARGIKKKIDRFIQLSLVKKERLTG